MLNMAYGRIQHGACTQHEQYQLLVTGRCLPAVRRHYCTLLNKGKQPGIVVIKPVLNTSKFVNQLVDKVMFFHNGQ